MRRLVVVIAIALACLATRRCRTAPHPVTFASFNIEFFPRDEIQVREAFAVIAGLDASAIGLQEITDPARFTAEVKARLGAAWDTVYQDARPEDPRGLHIAALYDTRVFALERVRSRHETRVDEMTQPTLQVELRERATDRVVTMLVVHFKAMPAGRALRIRQYAGLRAILDGMVGASVIVMGDFNATEPGDREDLARMGIAWASEPLACTAFWEREDDCATSRLDHVLTWKGPASITARGGCVDGCEVRDRCPLYHREVSDHCPVEVVMDGLGE